MYVGSDSALVVTRSRFLDMPVSFCLMQIVVVAILAVGKNPSWLKNSVLYNF